MEYSLALMLVLKQFGIRTTVRLALFYRVSLDIIVLAGSNTLVHLVNICLIFTNFMFNWLL